MKYITKLQYNLQLKVWTAILREKLLGLGYLGYMCAYFQTVIHKVIYSVFPNQHNIDVEKLDQK